MLERRTYGFIIVSPRHGEHDGVIAFWEFVVSLCEIRGEGGDSSWLSAPDEHLPARLSFSLLHYGHEFIRVCGITPKGLLPIFMNSKREQFHQKNFRPLRPLRYLGRWKKYETGVDIRKVEPIIYGYTVIIGSTQTIMAKRWMIELCARDFSFSHGYHDMDTFGKRWELHRCYRIEQYSTFTPANTF